MFNYWSLFYNKVISTFDTIIVVLLNQIRNNRFINFKEINNQDFKSESVNYLELPKACVCVHKTVIPSGQHRQLKAIFISSVRITFSM